VRRHRSRHRNHRLCLPDNLRDNLPASPQDSPQDSLLENRARNHRWNPLRARLLLRLYSRQASLQWPRLRSLLRNRHRCRAVSPRSNHLRNPVVSPRRNLALIRHPCLLLSLHRRPVDSPAARPAASR
jgi:hypothetical protein